MKNIFDYHVTAQGEEIRICHMEDSHLVNMICLICRRLEEASKVLNTEPRKTIAGTLVKHDFELLQEQAESAIERCMSMLPVYCMEAMRRSPEVQTAVTAAVQSAVPKTEDPVQLNKRRLLPPHLVKGQIMEDLWDDLAVEFEL